MDVRKMRNEKLGARVVAALESRNMEAYYVETKEEAVKKALELIPKGSSINMGGAASVKECGLYDAISNGEYEFYDRDKVKTPEEKEEIALKADLKTKKAALKSIDKEIARIEAKKVKAETKAAESAKKAEAEDVLKKLLASGVSADEILEKLK